MKWQTENSFSFCFPNGPTILNHKNLTPIQPIIQEKIVYLPLLDAEELSYTRKRFEKMGYCRIEDRTHKKISELSGGHYMLYKSISKAYANEQIETEVDSIKSNPQIHSILERIYQSALAFTDNKENILENGILEKIGLTKNGKFSIPLLPIQMKMSKTRNNLIATADEKDIRSDLTPQELLIFDFLHENLTKIKTKEELAKLIWGKNWPNEYSEQAIDKTISRLRSKLKDSRFQLTSIRNRGVRLVKI
jgi:regulator of sigma D